MFKKYLNNIISNAVLQIISTVVGLVVPVIILRTYGSTMNGLVNSIKQILAYLSIVEGGIGAISIAALYEPLSLKNHSKINGIVSAARTFYNRSGLIFFILVLLMAVFYPRLVLTQVSGLTAFLLVMIIGLGGVLDFFVIGKFRILLVADQRGYVVQYAQSVGHLLNLGLTLILIRCQFNIAVVQVGTLLAYFTRAVIISIYVRKQYQYIVFTDKLENVGISQPKDALIHQLSALVVFNTDILLLSLFSTLDEVSVYAVYRLVFTAISQLPVIFVAGVQPILGKINHTHSKHSFEVLYSQFELAYYTLVAFIYSAAFMLYMPFISIYTKGVVDANYFRPQIMYLFLAAEILNKLRVPSNILVDINGLFKQTKFRAAMEAVINLVVSLSLVRYGIVGVLIGTICSYLYRTTDFIVYTSRHILHRPSLKSLRMILVNIVVAILVVIIFGRIQTSIDTYYEWTLRALSLSIITLPMFLAGSLVGNWGTAIGLVQFLQYLKKARKTAN